MKLTNEEIMQVCCLECSAKLGKPCTENNVNLLGFHKSRVDSRMSMPVLPTQLPSEFSPTDKSIMIYYAFVMLCDSCSANSMKLFGKEFTSQEIQRMFGKEGLKKATAEGMIGIAPQNRKVRRAKRKALIIQ